MRFYLLRPQGRTPMFRGFNTASKWLDTEAPQITGTLRLIGDGAAEVEPGVIDRAGQEIACTVAAPTEIAEKDRPLWRMPEARRQLAVMSFEFPGARPVRLIDRRDGTELAVLEPQIVYPEFVFALLQEMQARGFPTAGSDGGSGGGPDSGFTNFIETGTLFGHTTLHASYWFDRVFTIELSQDLHAQAQRHLAHRRNVTCLQGNSGDRLPEVIAQLKGPSMFFLDAHWSGDNSVDWENSKFGGYPVETARLDDPTLSEGERQVPLLHELEAIAADHTDAAMVLIDDWQNPGLKGASFVGEDWSHIDPDRLVAWMAGHARTADHFQASWNRYVWLLNPA